MLCGMQLGFCCPCSFWSGVVDEDLSLEALESHEIWSLLEGSMNLSPLLDGIKDAAVIIGSMGTLVAVIWAIFVHFRNQRNASISRFREQLLQSIHSYTEDAVSFQIHVNDAVTQLFIPRAESSEVIISITHEGLQKTTKEEALSYYRERQWEIHESILHSLKSESLARAESTEYRLNTVITPLATFSPFLHELFQHLVHMLVEAYRGKLRPSIISDSTRLTFESLWDSRAGGHITLESKHDIRLHCRAILARILSYYTETVHFVDIMGKAIDLMKLVTSPYLYDRPSACWRHHKEDATAPLDRFERDRICESLREMVLWKFEKKKYPGLLEECLGVIDDLVKLTPWPQDSVPEDVPACRKTRELGS
jgi:hypothetical protein